MTLFLASCAVAGLLGLLLVRRRVARRLTRITSSTPSIGARRGTTATQGGAGEVPRMTRILRVLIAVAAGLGIAGFVGKWWAVAAGVVVGVVLHRILRRQEPPHVRADRLRAMTDLPLCADLLASALKAGAPVDRAVAAVADALGGPLGDRLERAARSLRMGADPAEAWTHLSDVAGTDRLVGAAIRSSASGGALAGALTRLADDLRADRAVVADAAARRAGVLIVLPLGLCFLPAFVLAGLVPVVIAVLGDVL
jgi:pilus assembly protein TadC